MIINGTLKQHIYLNNWAWAHNTDLLKFIHEIDNKIDKTDVYPIISMPDSTSEWLMVNCQLDFITKFYQYIPTNGSSGC